MTCDNAEGWESSGGSASSGLHLRHLWIDPANEADREFRDPELRIQGGAALAVGDIVELPRAYDPDRGQRDEWIRQLWQLAVLGQE